MIGFQVDDEHMTIFLEYVSGGSISNLLSRNGPFSIPVVQAFTHQILSGLAYLHERNILHRVSACARAGVSGLDNVCLNVQ